MTRYDRIKELCSRNNCTINGIEKELGFARGSLYKIDKSQPSSERIEKLAKKLNTTSEYILKGEISDKDAYYLNDDAREMAQFMYDNPDYKVLFDATRNVKKEDIQFVKDMLDRFRG